jgi:hypothetical protein
VTEYEFNIAYKEGAQAFRDDVLCLDCPYYGVSEFLSHAWEDGWWDMWYDE